MLDSTLHLTLSFLVRCLGCGTLRIVRRTPTHGIDRPVCLHCGYVGWTEAGPGPGAAG